MNTATIIPFWLGVPVAAAVMLFVAAHALSLGESDHPASRKRIRLASSVVMLLTVPLLTVAFCVLDPNVHPREWALSMLASICMVSFVLLLAGLDIINTMRLSMMARGQLRQELAEEAALAAAYGRERTPGDDGGSGHADGRSGDSA